MPTTEKIFCIIDPGGGPVSVVLQANNLLAVGSEFAVWAADGTTRRESWKLTAGAAGSGTHAIGLAPQALGDFYLSWELAVCSLHAAVDAGAVEIVLMQNGVSCPVTKDLHWTLEEVPQCDAAGDNVIKIQRSLRFKHEAGAP
jgi:hypothetical protein